MSDDIKQDPTITIDGKQYQLSSFSEDAKGQLASLRYIDQQIVDLQNQIAIYRTARLQYAEKLKTELSAVSEA
ncbi:MAG: DUF6447 family protein [Porticoccaceae bacterium]|jgi:hypothetical protein